jgi:prepilin-type N-terminal cleavage/methylation domain-containing protein
MTKPSPASGRHRAFTLMEVMLALSTGAIIAAGATFGMVTVFKTTIAMEKQSQVDQDAKLILDAVLGQVQELGGGNFRPNDMIRIEDNCTTSSTAGNLTLPACGESDRLHFIVMDDELPQCTIASTNGVNVNFDQTETPVCCSTPEFQSRGVIVVDTETGNWENRYCHNYQNNGSNCRCNQPSGQGPAGWNPPGGAGTGDFDLMTSGYAATIYLDSDNHVLMMAGDRNQDGVVESYKLAPNVWDFQAEFLFDLDNDGVPETATADIASVSDRSTLRMIKIGLVVGAEVSSRNVASSGQVLNGPARTASTGHLFRSAVGSTSMRNIYLFY